jgi:tetratricopeptide (TPR) repeat protein
LQDRRRQLHSQIVAAIELLYVDRLSEHVERLAHHAVRGQMWERAVRYSREAGARALDRLALRDALAAFDQARAALQQLAEGREQTEQRIDVCFDQRNALLPLGDFARLSEVVHEGRALSEALGDQRRLALALGYQAQLQASLGSHGEAIEAGKSACAIAQTIGDRGLCAVSNYHLGLALWLAGYPRHATSPLRAAIVLLQGAPLSERFRLTTLPPVIARYVLAEALAELGEFPEAFASGEEALQIAQLAGHPYSEVTARFGLGYAHLRHGDFAVAARLLEPSLALSREMEFRIFLPIVGASLGSAYLSSGRAAEAIVLLEEALEAITGMGLLGYRSWVVTSLAEAHLALGKITEARKQAERAVASARAQQEPGPEGWSLKLLGDIESCGIAEFDELAVTKAAHAYGRAFSLATELGMRPLIAHCHFGYGRCYRTASNPKPAREHLENAARMYREMEMHFWLEQAEAALSRA